MDAKTLSIDVDVNGYNHAEGEQDGKRSFAGQGRSLDHYSRTGFSGFLSLNPGDNGALVKH